MLRGRGGCYKHSFYGIESHRCMETTPSLACANKCVFCWRHHTNPGQSLQPPLYVGFRVLCNRPPSTPRSASPPPCHHTHLASPPCTPLYITQTLHHAHVASTPPCTTLTLKSHLAPSPPCTPTLHPYLPPHLAPPPPCTPPCTTLTWKPHLAPFAPCSTLPCNPPCTTPTLQPHPAQAVFCLLVGHYWEAGWVGWGYVCRAGGAQSARLLRLCCALLPGWLSDAWVGMGVEAVAVMGL